MYSIGDIFKGICASSSSLTKKKHLGEIEFILRNQSGRCSFPWDKREMEGVKGWRRKISREKRRGDNAFSISRFVSSFGGGSSYVAATVASALYSCRRMYQAMVFFIVKYAVASFRIPRRESRSSAKISNRIIRW